MNNYKTIRTALLRNNYESIVIHPLLNDHRIAKTVSVEIWNSMTVYQSIHFMT